MVKVRDEFPDLLAGNIKITNINGTIQLTTSIFGHTISLYLDKKLIERLIKALKD